MKQEELKQLLIDCSNFIQPYDDGGSEASRLMYRLDDALLTLHYKEEAKEEIATVEGARKYLEKHGINVDEVVKKGMKKINEIKSKLKHKESGTHNAKEEK